MAAIRPHYDGSESSYEKKAARDEHVVIGPNDADIGEAEDTHHNLHRGLQSRQITMIAIGGMLPKRASFLLL